MQARLFFLLFPLAILLMVIASVVTVMIVRPGVPEPEPVSGDYGVLVEAEDAVWPRFVVGDPEELPGDQPPVAMLSEPGAIEVEETRDFEGRPESVRVEFVARTELSDAARLTEWLNYESMMNDALEAEDKTWLRQKLEGKPLAGSGLLAASIAAWREGEAEAPKAVPDAATWIREDLRVLARVALREVFYVNGTELNSAEIEERLNRHLPAGLLEVIVREVRPVHAAE